MKTRLISSLACAALAASGCGDDTPSTMDEPDPVATEFRVRIEAVSPVFELAKSGAFNTPVGASEPGPVFPGGAYEFAFTAAPGSRLSFATMFVQSNDLFYAPDPQGIALFDDQGAISGDITDQIRLWDAGTELDEEPGLGPNQAPRQSGADAGDPDPNDTVRLATDDFGNLPAVADVIAVTVTPGADNAFVVRIQNVGTATTLVTSDAAMHPTPIAPGVFAVHASGEPLFSTGVADAGSGLEALAEDGNATMLAQTAAAMTGLTVPLSPGVVAVHTDAATLFDAGSADRGQGLSALAEDGSPGDLAAALAGIDAVGAALVFNTPVGASSPGPIGPGGAYEIEVSAMPGDRLSLATMFVPSNDLFFAFDGAGIPLFTGTTAISGDVTDMLQLWDVGTEVNQEPGVGSDQVMHQAGPNTGPEEATAIAPVQDAFDYPAVADAIRVTVTPL